MNTPLTTVLPSGVVEETCKDVPPEKRLNLFTALTEVADIDPDSPLVNEAYDVPTTLYR